MLLKECRDKATPCWWEIGGLKVKRIAGVQTLLE